MSSLIAPRYELPISDDKGRISREWYKFLVQVGQAAGPSTTANDDSLVQATSSVAGAKAIAQDAWNRSSRLVREFSSLDEYGCRGDGATDDAAAINSAIQRLSAAGGGVLYATAGKTYLHGSSIVLASNVYLSGYGATFNYTGSAQQITCPPTGCLLSAGIFGLSLSAGASSTKVLEVISAYRCVFRDILVSCTSTTNFVVDVLCNSSGTKQNGNYNSVFNSFENIVLDGSASCGTFIRLKGNSTSGQVVTDSTFYNCHIAGNGQAQVRGIDLAYCCDTIHFAGCTRIALTAPNAATGVGVEINTQDPTNIAAAVYNITFDTLAVDTFGAPAGDARVGLKLNATKQIVCAKYFNSPTAAGGDFVKDNTNTYSYWIQSIVSGTNDMVIHTNNTFIGGTDNATCAAGGELSTQDARFVAGSGRTGNGNSYLDLVGDATNTTYGARLLRGNAGANAVTQLLHRGTGNLAIFAQDAGAQVILQSQSGAKLVASNTGLGFYGSAALAQPTTASGSAAFVVNAGTAVNTLSTFDGYTIAQIVKGLRQMGLFA